MQIILLDKVVNLGNLGEIVRVKDGYARNFLIPSGRARRATESAKQQFEEKRAELEKAADAKLAEAQAAAPPRFDIDAQPTAAFEFAAPLFGLYGARLIARNFTGPVLSVRRLAGDDTALVFADENGLHRSDAQGS